MQNVFFINEPKIKSQDVTEIMRDENGYRVGLFIWYALENLQNKPLKGMAPTS